MSLTKRLYRIDEVRAAFLYSLKQRKYKESIFWLRELEDSKFGGEARRLLLIAWSIIVGIRRVSWFISWATNSFTREGRLNLCWQLLHCSERDSSIWLLLWSGIVPISNGYNAIVDRWISVCHLDEEEFWKQCNHESVLKLGMKSLQQDMRSYNIFGRAIAIILECKLPKTSWNPIVVSESDVLQSTLDIWESLDGRDSRVYEIPYDCLYGMTRRGSGGNTMDELYTLSTLPSSPYWKQILQEYKDDNDEWISPEIHEEFYETYFVDDIPDEWSLKDQKKSHGEGVNCSQGAPLYKWWRNWMPKDHIYIWGKQYDYITKEWILEQRVDIEGTILDRIYIFYKNREPMTPIPKKTKVWKIV